MKRTVTILLVIFGLNEILSGIKHMPIPCFAALSTEFDWAHAIGASIFTILFIIHAWLNREALFGYFRKLGQWWVPIGLGLAAVIWLGIIAPVLITPG